MTGDSKAGAASVLSELRPHETMVEDDVEQSDLLGMRDMPREFGPSRGRGRPAGSRNRRTAEWAGYLLQRYASPLEVLAQMATAPVAELATKLGCSPLEAMMEKRHAATALLPYLHQRMPLAVDLTNHRVVTLTIVDAPLEQADDMASEILQVVQDQGFSELPDDAV